MNTDEKGYVELGHVTVEGIEARLYMKYRGGNIPGYELEARWDLRDHPPYADFPLNKLASKEAKAVAYQLYWRRMAALCEEALNEALKIDENDFEAVEELALDLLHAQAMGGMLEGDMNHIVLSLWEEWEGDAWELYEVAKRRAGFGRLPRFFSDD